RDHRWRLVMRLSALALRLDHLRRSAIVFLRAAFFLQCRLFAENILIFRVSLGEVGEPEPLAKLQFARALAMTLDYLLDAPLDFRRRTLPPATEELIVLNLQLADVAFHPAKSFVNRCSHKL